MLCATHCARYCARTWASAAASQTPSKVRVFCPATSSGSRQVTVHDRLDKLHHSPRGTTMCSCVDQYTYTRVGETTTAGSRCSAATQSLRCGVRVSLCRATAHGALNVGAPCAEPGNSPVSAPVCNKLSQAYDAESSSRIRQREDSAAGAFPAGRGTEGATAEVPPTLYSECKSLTMACSGQEASKTQGGISVTVAMGLGVVFFKHRPPQASGHLLRCEAQ